MKLKNALILSFIALTLIPVAVVISTLYISGFDLSREAYTRNTTESINVQVDYMSQTLENNMVADYRFVTNNTQTLLGGNRGELLRVMQGYLQSAEDKLAVCLLLDSTGKELYTIGEQVIIDLVTQQLAQQPEQGQSIMEFQLPNGVYTLGSITPIRDGSGNQSGSLVSVYDKSYIFKSISSYYETTDSATYICRQNGDVVNYRGHPDEARNSAIVSALESYPFDSSGVFDMRVGGMPILGYYSNIHSTPWHLVGVVDHTQIYSFLNSYVWVYMLVILVVVVIDVLLAISVSKRVVRPINSLIQVMDGYPSSLNDSGLRHATEGSGYYETQYLSSKFLNLMTTILRVQHNFEGVYQLYHSSAIDDTNIDIDVKAQTIHSSKDVFSELLAGLVVPEGACIVERFTSCFCDKDRDMLMEMFVGMRDQHLSVTRESEVFTPYFDQKWFHILVVPMYEADRLSRLFVQLRDITGFKRQEALSLEQSQHDVLTGLYNRSGFDVHAASLLQDGTADATHALFFIDINDFKKVNDNFGHSAGDELLRSIATSLTELVRDNDITARLGGDEFAIFLPNTAPPAVERVRACLDALQYPYSGELASFTVTLSSGVATHTRKHPLDLEQLLHQSDSAMYHAKRAFKLAQQQPQ